MTSDPGHVRFSIYADVCAFSQPLAQVAFPVVGTVGIETRLSTPVGEVSVSTRKLGKRAGLRNPAEWSSLDFRLNAEVPRLMSAYNGFCALVAAGRDGWIPVKAAAGKTPRSRRVTVVGVSHKGDRHDPDRAPRRHIVTIPAVHLRRVGAQWYAPRWVLMRAVHANVLGGKGWPEEIAGGVFLDKETLWASAFAPLMALCEALRVRREEAQREWREREAARNAALRARAARDDRAATNEPVPAARAARSPGERHAKLERLEVAWVEWDAWEKVRQGRDTRLVKVTRTGGPCTLYFSGSRVYIVFDDGEVTKQRQNVRWGLQDAPAAP
jgi:hypothetical protein